MICKFRDDKQFFWKLGNFNLRVMLIFSRAASFTNHSILRKFLIIAGGFLEVAIATFLLL